MLAGTRSMLRNCILCCVLLVGASALATEFQPLEAKISPGHVPDMGELEAGLWMRVEQHETDVKNSPRRIRDDEINQYLHNILCRLSPDYCEDIRLYVTRVPFFNASMTPNGLMTVWSGLLLRVHNEAQLAAILGHELGHYLRRHGLDGFKDAKLKSNVATLLSLGFGFAAYTDNWNADVYSNANDIGQYILLASRYAHSRAAEREADQFGVQLMSEAGYDPFEAARVWKNIIDEEEAAKRGKLHGSPFFATHPAPKDRLATLDSYARILTANKAENGEIATERFMRHMMPYWKTLLEDELRLNQSGKTEFILDNLIAGNVVPGVVHFYKGELYRQRKETGDTDLARQHYLQALQSDYFLPETYRSLGLLQLKEKRMPEARENLKRYLAASPDAEDREMIEYYLTMGQ